VLGIVASASRASDGTASSDADLDDGAGAISPSMLGLDDLSVDNMSRTALAKGKVRLSLPAFTVPLARRLGGMTHKSSSPEWMAFPVRRTWPC